MRPFHARLARLGLAATEQYGFVLAGGYAVGANGMGERLSEDVDLFTNLPSPEDFAAAVAALLSAYRDAGLESEIGPVLDAKDAVANKLTALYSRGETRDFIDIDLVVRSGRFSRDQVIALGDTRETEPLDRTMLAARFREVARHTERQFARYGVGADERGQVVGRFLDWARTLDPTQAEG